MVDTIKNLFQKYKQIIMYGSISVFVTIIDISICFILENFMDKLYANAIGVIAGFIIEYFLASKKVFNSRNKRTLIIYIITFFIGFGLAQFIIWFSRGIIFGGADTFVAFIVSKGLSILIPFFVMFGLRKVFIKEGQSI